MKMKILTQTTTILLMAFLVFSCGKDDNGPAPNDDDGPIGMDDDVPPPPDPTATAFKWETAEADGNTTTETLVDGTTLTVTNDAGNGIEVSDESGLGGSTDNIAKSGATTSVTFDFDAAVDVNSILPIETGGTNADYIFTRTGGNGVSPITVSLVDGAVEEPVVLNWTGVTSFTVTTDTAVPMGFDDLIVNEALQAPTATAYGWETAVISGQTTVETLANGTTLTMTNDADSGVGITDGAGLGGSTDNIVTNGATSSVSFAFDQPIDVNSILPIEAGGQTVDYTITRTDGGDGDPIMVSLVDGLAPGSAPVDLNWFAVSSFEVTAATDVAIAFDDLVVGEPIPVPILFGFETVVDNGDDVTETISGVTLIASAATEADLNFGDLGGALGSSGNVLVTGALVNGVTDATLITFTFSEPVDVVSMWVADGNAGTSATYTFTPTGGSNDVITQDMTGNIATVNFDWTDVTSFTIESDNGSWFLLDHLSVVK